MHKVKLVSHDGKAFEVDIQIVGQLKALKSCLEELASLKEDKLGIKLPNINADILEKVIQWCTQHRNDVPVEVDADDDIPLWDKEFLEVEIKILFQLIYAATCLDIKGLLDLTCKTFVNMIIDKPEDEILRTFNIPENYMDIEPASILNN